jgi:hypothetical protein
MLNGGAWVKIADLLESKIGILSARQKPKKP